MPTDTVQSYNYLSPVRFAFIIDTPDLANISFLCQTVNMPAMSVDGVQMPYRGFRPQVTGDRVVFDNFEAKFIIDEYLENYTAIYEWLLREVTVAEPEQTKHKDVILLIYSNNNKLSARIKFISAFPVSLSPVPFDTSISETQYLFADVSFSVDYFLIESLRT